MPTPSASRAGPGPSAAGDAARILGKRYWFSVPFRGILLATVFYVIALIISWT